jgi:hypothetical protein
MAQCMMVSIDQGLHEILEHSLYLATNLGLLPGLIELFSLSELAVRVLFFLKRDDTNLGWIGPHKNVQYNCPFFLGGGD